MQGFAAARCHTGGPAPAHTRGQSPRAASRASAEGHPPAACRAQSASTHLDKKFCGGGWGWGWGAMFKKTSLPTTSYLTCLDKKFCKAGAKGGGNMFDTHDLVHKHDLVRSKKNTCPTERFTTHVSCSAILCSRDPSACKSAVL